MIKQDISIIEGVTFTQDFKTESDISGFSFKLNSNHPERNFTSNLIEVFDATGEIRLHIPANMTGNFKHLSKYKYSIIATSADGVSTVLANGGIKYIEAEDAVESETVEFTTTGASDNLLKKLMLYVDKKVKEITPSSEKPAIKASEVVHGSKTLIEYINSVVSKTGLDTDKRITELCTGITDRDKSIDSLTESVNGIKSDIDSIKQNIDSMENKLGSFAAQNNDSLRLFNGDTSIGLNKKHGVDIAGVKVQGDIIKANKLNIDSVSVKGSDITDMFASKNGDVTQEFKAKKIVLDGQDLSIISSMSEQIKSLRKRIAELEKNG